MQITDTNQKSFTLPTRLSSKARARSLTTTIIAVIVLILAYSFNITNPESQPGVKSAQDFSIDENKFYEVTKVVDGDTIKVSELGTLRMIGIDTPEIVDPRKPVECFGREASDKAKDLLLGKKVRLEVDNSQERIDRYDRLLVYVYTKDGLFFNQEMIRQGYAHEYTYSVPYKYQIDFRNAQRDAQENNRGLWGAKCNN
ncbi:MAG: Micrococcal nuclease [candidate division WS6 bacterium GW2011_GWF2_39_15]|uniref:Micrococcal nuclease n=1 Tax=candidate division WS6 bacterium GW2011_GWF2_39_15 TaxID=1619100 RepID=A0A0G0MQF9_9BACT|nr:MAG: Micrococcal nuclease [candidate division WS6 bacterium GW2011_GWF2_39_15]